VHATVRRYVGNAGLADALSSREAEVVDLIKGAPGFRAYYLIKAGADTISVTVCDDESGAQETNRIAAEWLRANLPDAAPSPPEIAGGEVVVTAG
jgi:hypothetical protein